MAVELKPDTEARLLAKAREQGVSVDALLDQFVREGDLAPFAADGTEFELPVWHLGARDCLHRRDIYSDVG